jgi:predicted transposase YbfD/YdcC
LSIGFRQVKGKAPQLGYRYYISSAELSEKALAEAVRAHWSIENSLHWVVDVSLGEDQCQIHHQNGAENWAMLRQLSLNMLRAESSKGSISAKRKRAWMKPTFLEAVLKAGFSEMCKN